MAAQPVAAQPAVAPEPVAEAPAAAESASVDGKAVYDRVCFACHGTGAAGAPKLGDKAAWAPRIAQGKATLLQHATNGFNVMPPKGGNMSLSDNELEAAVEYLMAQGQ